MLDKVDKQILSLLQSNARMTNADLAERVNLSPTPCLRRVKRLEEQGIIKQYVTDIDKEKVGLQITAFVFVQLERNNVENAAVFESSISQLDEVMDCYVLTGEYDYLLNVVTENLSTYEKFIKTQLAGIPQVAKIDTTIVLNHVKSGRQLPLK